MQICFHPEGQTNIDFIFRGKGKRVFEAEKLSWHPDVYVFFQENAHADSEFCIEWVEQTLKPVVKEPFVLFLGNLNSQACDEFGEAIANLNGVCWDSILGVTDIW